LIDQPTEEEELGKFWFEMYQRVKQELSNERAHCKALQKKVSEQNVDYQEDEGEVVLKEKIIDLRNEVGFLEKNNQDLL